MTNNILIITTTLISLFLTLSCSNKKDNSQDPIAMSKKVTLTSEDLNNEVADFPDEKKDFPENYLEIMGNDAMKFNLKELKVKTGKPVTLVLKHIGKEKKQNMGHNLVILKPNTNVEDFAKKAVKSIDTDFIPQSELSSIIAHTKLLGGGESDTITFTINKKGSYDFICSFPGHHSLMRGILIAD